MYITTVVFIGSEGNKTVEVEESTDKKYAKMKYLRALDRWFKILTNLDDDDIVHNMYRPQTLDILVNYDKKIKNKLKFIKMYLDFCNEINDTNCSFSINMYEGEIGIEMGSDNDISDDDDHDNYEDDDKDEDDDKSEQSEEYDEWKEKRDERRLEALVHGILEE